jgi:hypothetical protein
MPKRHHDWSYDRGSRLRDGKAAFHRFTYHLRSIRVDEWLFQISLNVNVYRQR